MLRPAPLRRSDRDYYSQASLRAKKMTVAATRRPRSCGHIGWSWRVWMRCQSFCLQVETANGNERCRPMRLSPLAALAVLAACSNGPEQNPTGDHRAGTDDRALLDRTAPGGQGDLAKERGGTEGPLEPQNPEAARRVLLRYFTLIEAGRYDDAAALWWDGGRAADFAAQLRRFGDFRPSIAAPGPVGVAAGSTYVDISLQLLRDSPSGVESLSDGNAVLRRAGEIPGSTAEQRQWHIDRIALQPPPVPGTL